MATPSATCSAFVTSALKNFVAPPSSLASASPFSALKSRIVTSAPPAASRRTVASPRPDAPPLTIAAAPLMSMGRQPRGRGFVGSSGGSRRGPARRTGQRQEHDRGVAGRDRASAGASGSRSSSNGGARVRRSSPRRPRRCPFSIARSARGSTRVARWPSSSRPVCPTRRSSTSSTQTATASSCASTSRRQRRFGAFDRENRGDT